MVKSMGLSEIMKGKAVVDVHIREVISFPLTGFQSFGHYLDQQILTLVFPAYFRANIAAKTQTLKSKLAAD